MDDKFSVKLGLDEVVLINKLFPGYIDFIIRRDFVLKDYEETTLLVMLKFSQVLWLLNEQTKGNITSDFNYKAEVEKLRDSLKDILKNVDRYLGV